MRILQSTIENRECTNEHTPQSPDGRTGMNGTTHGAALVADLDLVDSLSFLDSSPPVLPSVDEYLRILDHCRRRPNPSLALRLHAHLRDNGLESHTRLACSIVSLLAESGSVHTARQVFDRLHYPDPPAFNSLIIAYVRFGEPQCALDLHPHLCFPDSSHLSRPAIVALLKACAKLKDLQKGSDIHAIVRSSGKLESDVFIGSTLVDMYAKCGLLTKAQMVFDTLPSRNEITWNALIMGYVKAGQNQKAIGCFKNMKKEGLIPNAATFISVLKACSNTGSVDEAQQIIAEIVEQGLESDLLVGSALIDSYSKLGLLAKAQGTFNKLLARDVISWTSLVAGYAEHGSDEEVMEVLDQMQQDGVPPNAVTYTCSLKACGNMRSLVKGQQLHAEVSRKGLLNKDVKLDNALVDMYMKCGYPEKAQEVFDKIWNRDLVSWNILIFGYVEHESGEKALKYFDQMQREGYIPDAFTFVCALKACGCIKSEEIGAEIHREITRQGLLERNLVVGNALIDMYGKCELPAKAQEVFYMLPNPNIISWTAVMSGYADCGYHEEVLHWYYEMQREGFTPDPAAFSCGLKSCGGLRAMDKGQKIHLEIVKTGMEQDVLIGSILVDMYVKCSAIPEAQDVFDRLSLQDVVTWTSLITGYAEYGQPDKALYCFERMQRMGVIPNAVTYLCCLKACGYICAAETGKLIHSEIIQSNHLARDAVVLVAIIDMYAKCGLALKAQEVFENLSVQDVVSWNALVTGYSLLGESQKVSQVIDRMFRAGKMANSITFISVLNACSHAGLLNEGQTYFEMMVKYCDIQPDHEHLTCIIDLLGRTGNLREAIEIIKRNRIEPDVVMWHTVLSACQRWGYSDLGRVAFESAMHLNVNRAATYVCMSNIYADVNL